MRHGGQIIIIAAAAENGVIGRNNALPWSIKEDLIHFKKLTLGFPCIMGRKTWESLPHKPLPGRLNIILSASMAAGPVSIAGMGAGGTDAARTRICAGLEEALGVCGGWEKIFICGGASVYREALPRAGIIELTRIHGEYEGDAYFPVIDPGEWEESAAEDYGMFSFITLIRKKAGSSPKHTMPQTKP
ncbi:MAG: dihydrofolate reductase [Treponema sp.]|jgi:dihydrofolate reductase|nr:dihydrofolate reductase [Treponema sp.]